MISIHLFYSSYFIPMLLILSLVLCEIILNFMLSLNHPHYVFLAFAQLRYRDNRLLYASYDVVRIRDCYTVMLH